LRLTISSRLKCPPERVWDEVRTTRLFLHVCRPLVRFAPAGREPLPEVWVDGTYQVKMSLLGVLPLGTQWIVPTVTTVDLTPGRQRYEIRDDGRGTLIPRWSHRITLRGSEGGTVYTDEVEVGAGLLTPLAWSFALLFFLWRQRRWRRVVRRGFSY
jgi:hypothetical protein